MAISALSAAKFICEEIDWTVTNLKLQKILYLAHMVHMGRTKGEKLVREKFEAWDYGPVVPEIYHEVKMFGAGAIKNIFLGCRDVPYSEEKELLSEALKSLLSVSAGRLVHATHREKGAWMKTYIRGSNTVISDGSIL